MFWPTMIRRPRCGTGTVAEAIHRSRPWPWSVTRGKAADPELISSPGHQGSHPALIPCRPAGRINREDPAYGEEMGPYRVPDPPRKPFPPRRGASACTWLSRFPLATSRRPPPASADRNLQETEGVPNGKTRADPAFWLLRRRSASDPAPEGKEPPPVTASRLFSSSWVVLPPIGGVMALDNSRGPVGGTAVINDAIRRRRGW